MLKFDLSSITKLRWKVPPDQISGTFSTNDSKFLVNYGTPEPYVENASPFFRVGELNDKYRTALHEREYNDLKPDGYMPNRDFTIIGNDVKSIPVRNNKIYVIGNSSFYRFGGKLDSSEVAFYANRDLSGITSYVEGYASRYSKEISIPGFTVALHGWSNWDHFLRQTISSLVVCLENFTDISLANLSIIAGNLNDRTRSLLVELGIDSERIYNYGDAVFQFEHLLLSPANRRLKGPSQLYSRTADFLCNKLNVERGGPEKLYVSRRLATRRKISNEEEIEALLSEDGYLCLDPGAYALRDQVQLFANAKTIIGPHGMGLANAIFGSELKTLVEIMPSSWLRISYIRTAQLRRAGYGVLVVNPGDNDESLVDLNKLTKLLGQLPAT